MVAHGEKPGVPLSSLKSFFRALNSQSIGKFGLSLIALGGAPVAPGVSNVVDLLPANVKHGISVGSAICIGVGSLLAYFGRPVTVADDKPIVPPSSGPVIPHG